MKFLIYCDDNSHAGQIVNVRILTVMEWRGSNRGCCCRSAGFYSWTTSEMISMMWTLEDLERREDAGERPMRFKYRFSCRICRHPLVTRYERLNAAVKPLAGHGVSRLSMSALASMLDPL